MADAFMPQVKNIVFLMLENRALDNLLGWLYTPTSSWRCPSRPLDVYPQGSSPAYDGLTAGKYSNPDSSGASVPVIPVSDAIWSSGYAVPYRDPYEALRAGNDQDPRDPGDNWHGVMNQFFGNQNIITTLPSQSDGVPAMKGFLQDYDSLSDGSWHGHDVLWGYTPLQAHIINSLALKYAVSDRWFCSVPSETNPNRAYSICATSDGRESNQHWNSEEQFNLPTIFNAIGPQKSWGIYFTDKWVSGQSYTEYTFENIANAPNGEFGDIAMFCSRAHAGTLKAFTYLEPSWTGLTSDGTDYHPNAHIAPGEAFLHLVYDAVRNGPQWPNTLFIITFDEHGGTYDHVPPPWGAQNPDGRNGIENGFKFDLFGARVPTIFVSPFVSQSTVFRAPEEDIKNNKYPFDHTSFVKTLLKWAGVYESQAASFGKRMLNAPTFEGVLADHAVNDGIVSFERPQEMEPPIVDTARPVHPAGTRVELRELLKGIPVVAARTILETNKTREDVRIAVERYKADPKAYETWLKTNAGGRRL